MSAISEASSLDGIQVLVDTEIRNQYKIPADAELSFYVHTILDDGCYECETGNSTGPVNEAGGGECMAGYTFIEFLVNGKPTYFHVNYGSWEV